MTAKKSEPTGGNQWVRKNGLAIGHNEYQRDILIIPDSTQNASFDAQRVPPIASRIYIRN